MREAGEGGADFVLVAEIEAREGEALLIAAFGDDDAPRIDDQRVPVTAARRAVRADLRGRHHVDLVLDRARAQQDVPVILAGLERERRRHRDDARPLRGVRSVQLGETQVVADAEV